MNNKRALTKQIVLLLFGAGTGMVISGAVKTHAPMYENVALKILRYIGVYGITTVLMDAVDTKLDKKYDLYEKKVLEILAETKK